MKENGVDLNDDKQVLNFVKNKIKKEKINIPKYISKIENGWRKVEDKAIKRMDKIHGWPFAFPNLTVYLSLNSRYAYNPDENYFFVDLFSSHPNGIILHELMHFYAHKYIAPIFKKNGLSKEQKGSLKGTVLKYPDV